MIFVWTDRDHRVHELTNFDPILAEAEAIKQDIDRLVGLAESSDTMVRDAARSAVRIADARLRQLQADLKRWNTHASEVTGQAASALVERIDTMPGEIAAVSLVVALHDEHDRLIRNTDGNVATRDAMLAGPMTAVQRQAIETSGSRSMLHATATRAEAKAWLDDQPRFARGRSTEGGWFTWINRHGHALRLVDPLPIERELVAFVEELGILRPRLVASSAQDALYAAVSAGIRSVERCLVLQSDLERFTREAKAREDAAWTRYAADWRSKRNT